MDTLKIYLRDVARRPRISRAEEIALARRIQSGDRSAIRELVEANLRLGVSVARRLTNGEVTMDAIQEANLGLMRAAESYDPDRAVTFSTYSTWWIKNFVLRDRWRSGPAPVALPHKLHRASDKQPEWVLAMLRRASLDALADQHDPRLREPWEILTEFELDDEAAAQLAVLREEMALLDPRQRDVLWRRARGEKLREIGAALGLSKQRVAQLEQEAKRQLREALLNQACHGCDLCAKRGRERKALVSAA